VLDKAVEAVKFQETFKGIEFQYQYQAELSTIQADPAQLQQVFINLLNNAAESIIDGGRITIATRLLDANHVEIKISDTGCGIPAENLGKLFTPFFTTKGSGKGTGLGLAIVYGIIKMHRGQINIQSQVDRGTTITVTLPVKLPPGQLNQANGAAEVIG